ncbi:putative uncharacterized protein DDB_G0287113 [Thunnus thynnus]|uniref:putative uncharacterized protein DDB_G0287113 n=1 Tax=Thunnus thynnus TaxID=8237 RepID=UPI003528A25A
MAKRKSKKQQEDTSVLLEPSAQQSKRKIKSYASSVLLLFIITFTIGASVMGWFCVQHQQTLDQLSESFTTMQNRITNFQQVMKMTDSQPDTGLVMEERIFALEEAQKQAQQKVEVALSTSEKLKHNDFDSQLLALHAEMDTRWEEIKQVSLSVTTLQAMFNNQNEEFEAMKESVVAGLSSSSALAAKVAGLTSAVDSACSRADEQVALVEALNAQLEGHASELNDLKGSLYLHNVALYTNTQEMVAIKELVAAKQAMRAQALEEMLSSVQMTLDEQFFTSKTLHSSIMAQLQSFHSKLANGPSWSMKLNSNAEGPAAEEFISTTAQNATEVQEKLEDVEEEAEQEDAEEQVEEEAMEEKQPLQQEVEGDVTEEEEEITGQSEEQEDAGETAEEELAADSLEGHETSEDEVLEDVVERETVEEESVELNSEVVMDEDGEDE